MVFTDTHCHLYLSQFDTDLPDLLQRSADAGVHHIFLPAIDWESIGQMDRLNHPEIHFYKMAGIHPCSVEENLPIDENRLFDTCSRPEFVGVGETGLDYYWSTKHIEEQKESLRIHCRIAKSVSKPVVLHNRESTSDLLDIIEQEQDGTLTGVWHCFTGTADEGRRALDTGLYLGVGGVSTFKNAGVDRVLREMPPEKMILETDSPYLAPVPHRGKRNEPSYIKLIAENLAELLDLPVEEVATLTTAGAAALFGVDLQRT